MYPYSAQEEKLKSSIYGCDQYTSILVTQTAEDAHYD